MDSTSFSTLVLPRHQHGGRIFSTFAQTTILQIVRVILIISLLMPNLSGAIPTTLAASSDHPSVQQPFTVSKNELTGFQRPVISRPEPRTGIRSDPGHSTLKDLRSWNDPSTLITQVDETNRKDSSPLLFVENVGQYDSQARFQVQGTQGTVFLSPEAVWVSLFEPKTEPIQDNSSDPVPVPTPSPDDSNVQAVNEVTNGVNLRFQFVDANSEPTIEGFVPSTTQISYFIGADPSLWHPNVPVWTSVRYIDLYPGVDLVVSSVEGLWNWELSVKDALRFQSGQDDINKNGIHLRIDGAEDLSIEKGFLHISTKYGELRIPEPQLVSSNEEPLPFDYQPSRIDGNELIIFPYEPSLLQISPSQPDPIKTSKEMIVAKKTEVTESEDLIYSTYLGGGSDDVSFSIAANDNGDTYITGQVFSTDFPVNSGDMSYNGNGDGIVSKISSDGQYLIYSTFIGGSDEDCAMGCDIAIDPSGRAYVTGSTKSSDFPTVNAPFTELGGPMDAFVLRLGSSGAALDYSTYLGGTAYDFGHGIAVETGGFLFVTGMTSSSNFYTTNGSYSPDFNGNQDAFVVKIDTDSSDLDSIIYSTYIGGESGDQGHGIAVLQGMAYVTGQTYSDDFPTINSYQASYSGYWDSFALKLNSNGSDLIFSTYLGGSNDDCEINGNFRECAIAVDETGAIYLTGKTNSNDFPLLNAVDSTFSGSEAYVAKLDPGGSSLIFSTFMGGTGGEAGFGIVVDSNNAVYVTGKTDSSDFPLTDNAFRQAGVYIEGFVSKFNSVGGLIYSSYLGGSDWDEGIDITTDALGLVYITGMTKSSDFPVSSSAYDKIHNGGYDTFVTNLGLGEYSTVVSDPSTGDPCDDGSGPSDDRECPRPMADSQGFSGDPINTRTGSFSYSLGWFSLPTSAGSLDFMLSYSSLVTDIFTATLGYGWTHNHDTRLVFPGDPGGEPDAVWFKAHSTNLYKFIDNQNGTYTAIPGVLTSLTRQDGPPVTYTLTDPHQNVYLFNADGNLIRWSDEQDHGWNYNYDEQGRLEEIIDDTDLRYLQLDYDGQGRIEAVSDHTDRGISFGYDGAGDLNSITDLLDDTWNLTYDGSHRLRIVENPGETAVVHTEYDNEGRAWQQYDGDENLTLEIDYHLDGTSTISDTFGNEETQIYSPRNILTNQVNVLGDISGKVYNNGFRPVSISDQNGNGTLLFWSADDVNLTRIVNAENGQTDLVYDDLNNLTEVIDPLGYLTSYVYSGTLLIENTNAYTQTTVYSYTTSADAPQPIGLLKAITDPLGHTTSFTYNQFGQRLSTTDASDRTTNFAYDDLGRLEKVTHPTGQSDWTCYDEADRVIRTVRNASGDGGTPQTDPCDVTNYQPSATPGYDRIVTIVYDVHGNVIASIDPNGLVTRTYYDSNKRPVTVVQNLVGQSIETPDPPAYNPSFPNQNIRTDTVYDDAGNGIASIDPLGRITRIYYDQLNRPQFSVQNLTGQNIEDPAPPTYDPDYPDRNLLTETVYDAAGNVIATIDVLGKITRTYYDANNWAVTVVQNLVGQSVTNRIPPEYDPNYPDQNIRTDTVYDLDGNAIATIDTLGHVTRTYYDALNRPATVAVNLTGQAIEVATPPTYDPDFPDQNVLSDYVYDEAGSQIAAVDPLGRITRTYYDASNRPQYIVQNLVGQSIENTTPPEYNPAYPDQNVRTETVYDEDGRTIATIDPLGRITRTYYDVLQRPYLVVQNLVGQSIENTTPPDYNPAYPDQNVRVETVYDADGKSIATIDNGGQIIRTYYDVLQRPYLVVQNLVGQSIENTTPPEYNPAYPDQNVRSETVYGAGGNVTKMIEPTGQVTYTCYDGVYRVIKTVVNPSVPNPCTSYSPSLDSDQDITTLTTYDAAGNRLTVQDPNDKTATYQYDSLNRLISVIDPLTHATTHTYDGRGNRTDLTDAKNVVTHFEYDALGRLAAVVENYRPGVTANNEINVRTEYTYDANGSRLTIRDANAVLADTQDLTVFTYDALGRLTNEQDPLDHTTSYGYDGAGNRTSSLDANGATTAFTYDALNRITTIDYPAPDTDVTFTYDAAGNRSSMSDSLGTTSWIYDDLYRPIEITDPFSGTVGYGYDASGKRTSLDYPDSKEVSYVYDDAGRLSLVTSWDLAVTQYTHDKVGRAQTVTLPNGIETTYEYDDAGRLENLTHVLGVDTLSSYEYGYDEVGNRTSVSEAVTQPGESLPDLLFADGFESGNLSAWGASKTDGGDLSASTTAAITGTYGMQAVIDDNNDLYVTEWTPVSEPRYRARFYFDPNSISMANGDEHYLFQVVNSANVVIARLELQSYQGDYQIRASLVNDSTGWTNTAWYTIRDYRHYIELDWRAASAAGANNGGITLWIDGVQKANIANVDNDTRRADYVRLGALGGIDNGTRGTYIFDVFESHRQNYIGPDPEVPDLPPPTPPDALFADGFESGSFSAWSVSTTDSGDLSVSAQAAITGTYGMQAVLDDNVAIYVTDWQPFEETRYRARFYFDPNSIPMANGDAYHLLYASNRDNIVVARIELRFSVGDYQVRAEVVNDASTWTSSSWVTLTDGPHALEIDWRAATAPGANNGGLTFWVDGAQQANFTTIDNDTRWVDYVQWGAVSGIDNGSRGTLYFDAFESRRETYIGLVPGAPDPPAPDKPDALFADGFESGSFSAWSVSATDSGDLSVSAQAAMVGTYGMQAVLDDNTSIFVTDWRPFDETRYRARFHFDPNSTPMANGDAYYLIYASNRDNIVLARVELRFSVGDYQVRAEVINDGGGWSSSSWVTLTDGPHALEIDWRAATGAGANNGGLTFWVDGTQQANFTNVDNDTRKVDYVQWGAVAGVDTGTRGTLYFDAFESHRETYIGPDPNAPAPPGPPAKPDALFADGFESGSFSAWSVSTTDGGDLSVSAQAVMVGNYGMQAVLDDNTNIYVTDWQPFEETRYRARFHLDPNSIPMANGETFTLLQASNRDNAGLATIEFRFSVGDYQARAGLPTDGGSWSWSGWITLTDGPHALEIDWRAATAPGANNGGLTFWVDGTQQANFTNIDNDTRKVDYVQWGAVSGIDNGSRGTLYFDAFESRRETYIGPDPNAPEPPGPPAKPDALFADGLESGNFSAWSVSTTDSGDLSVSAQAAITGTYGMQAVLDDNNSIFVTDWRPFEETRYRARFYFDPYSTPMANGDTFPLLQAGNRDNYVLASIELRFSVGDYQVRAGVPNDGLNWSWSGWFTLTDGPHALEIDWRAATAPGANNGGLTFWVDGTQQANFTNIDNDTRKVDYVLWGAVSGVDTGTRGTLYFDAFESRRENYIGLAPGAPDPPAPDKPDALFPDGFESGSFSAWTSNTNDGGDLSVSAQSAITGTYGMQAVLDDNTSIFVTDWRPFDETRYRARFYFDPNSIPMATGDAHYLLYASNRDNIVVARIELRFSVGDYQVRAEAVNDGSTWSSSSWLTLTDGPHALEIDWRAATGAGANNGGLTFWVDGTQQANFTNIDNDTRKVDYVQWGAVSSVDSGTRGTLFFDAFESRRETYIGLAPGAPEPPAQEKPDALFADGFESGSFSAWSVSTTDSGDLSVSAQAAITGSYGMQAVLDDNNSIYVTEWRPFEETRYRARFYLDPNTISMTSGNAHYIFYGLDRNNVVVARIEFRYYNSAYQLRAEAVNDASGWSSTSWVSISDQAHFLEFDWLAATAPGANNGGLTFWVDETQQGSFANIDNDTRKVDYVQWGAVSSVDNGSRGTCFFDSFESRRETYIGPQAGLLMSEQRARARLLQEFSPEEPTVVANALPSDAGEAYGLTVEKNAEAPAYRLPALPQTALGWPGKPLHIGMQMTVNTLDYFLAAPKPTAADPAGAQATLQPASAHPMPEAKVSYYSINALLTTVTTEITYTYDPLYRLTQADYDDGTTFRYTYDAAGNRLTEETVGSLVTAYTYDVANRLTSVDGVPYTWDDNGNLLSDGARTYAYNRANRLTGVSWAGTTVGYTYNGLGDRLRQTINGVPTNYTLDLAAGLTQALTDGTNTYLYGAGRLAQYSAAEPQYYLGDALGSVRQLADETGALSLAKSYQPYGEVLNSNGSVATIYGFANEWTDSYNKLIYLRSRWYDPASGRFPTKDSWHGDYKRPLSLNRWNYGYSNPIRYTDSSGLQSTDVECDKIMLGELKNLCKIANMDDKDPQKSEEVLQARETFFRWIVGMSYAWSVMPEPWGGEGYYYAGKMLGYFLNSASYVRVDLGGNTRFDDDPGIMRATWKSMPATAPDEPMTITPLLYSFLMDYIKPNIGCDKYQVLPPDSRIVANNPRPQTVGWWGAFGHVPFIEATYSNITIMRTYGDAGYVVKTQVKYHVLDKYEWFGGATKTPLPLGYPNPGGKPPFNYVEIPHEWEDSLVAANRAIEYQFDIYWSDYFQIVLPNDFSQFLPFGKSGWIPLE